MEKRFQLPSETVKGRGKANGLVEGLKPPKTGGTSTETGVFHL